MMAAHSTLPGDPSPSEKSVQYGTVTSREDQNSSEEEEQKTELSQGCSIKTECHCLACGSSDGNISAFTRIGNSEPLIHLLSFILKKSVVDIDLHSNMVCSKCFKKFESVEKLLCKLIDVCRDVIHNFNKTLRLFMKASHPPESVNEDDECLLVLNGMDLKSNESGIFSRALSQAAMKKVDKRKKSEPERKFICPVCGKAFRAYSHKVEHMLVHTKDKSQKCDICGFLTSTKSNLAKHKQQHTLECVCNICNKKLCNKFSLREHMKIHTNKKKHQCDYCEKTFLRYRDKWIHENIHIVKGPEFHRCEVCQKCFVVKSRLVRHMLIHQKEKQFVCQVCNKKFVRKDDLKCHERVHTGEKPYSCKECGRVFRYISNCRNHMRIHMKDSQIYKCRYCNISFPTEGKYSNHLKTRNHKKKMSVIVCDTTEQLNCDGNKVSFTSAFTLQKTVYAEKKQKQEASELMYCSVCCLAFENADQLTEHTLNSHEVGSNLPQNTATPVIISGVDVGSDTDIVSLTPLERLTVTGEGMNMMVAMESDSTTLQIPLIQRSPPSATTTLLPGSIIIDESNTSSPALPMNMENKATGIIARSEVSSAVLREVSDNTGIICSETIEQPIGESTSSSAVTILNPSTIFKMSEWDINQYYQKS